MPHCPPEAQLELYLAGTGDGHELSSIDSHVDSCAACRAWLADARADDALLAGVRIALADGNAPAHPRPAQNSSSADVRDLNGAVPAHPVQYDASARADSRPSITAPPQVAGYRVRGVLGEGGMGVVYAADQDYPRREVALKLIRGSQQFDAHRGRLFRREADALARLRHPGIAAIYDAGSTPTGEPYFVMELVRGVALDAWARRANPSLRTRLELFLKICDAIGYAHQRGVIHRDLKPSNILVSEEGARTDGHSAHAGEAADHDATSATSGIAATPKVLDFGLARVTDTDALDGSSATILTEIGKIQGTLAYMSPEQARGNADEIDVRSDLYSLGVILFELLTGERPYTVSRTQLAESVRTICETPPRRPSTLVRATRGDLETIILKALEKSPERRYSGVAALRDDVQRYLANEPIQARPPSATYQLRKLVARHKLPTALVAALLTTLCAFAVWATWQYQHAERLRLAAEQGESRAAAKAATAEEIQRFLQSVLESVDPDEARGRDTEILRELLANAAARVENELADQPEVAAAIRITIGNTYANLGHLDRAEPQLRAALSQTEQVFGPDSLQAAVVLVDLGRLLRIRERHDEGEALMRRGLAIRRQHLGEDHIDVAEALNNLGTLLNARGRIADAAATFEQALAIHERVRGTEDVELATALSNLGLCYFRLGRIDEAEARLRSALDIRRRVRPGGDAGTAMVLANLCTLLIHFKQDRDAAIDLQREACDIRRRLLPADHPDLIISLQNLATSLAAIDRDLEAVPVYYEALDRQRALLARLRTSSDPPRVRSAERDLAGLLHELGNLLIGFGFYDEAEPHLRAAAGLRDTTRDGEEDFCGRIALSYGRCLKALGRYADAAEELLVAHALLSQRPASPNGQRAARELVELYEAWGRPDAADLYRAPATAPPPPR